MKTHGEHDPLELGRAGSAQEILNDTVAFIDLSWTRYEDISVVVLSVLSCETVVSLQVLAREPRRTLPMNHTGITC